MERGLYELRSFFGTDTVRIFYFFFSGERIVLTNGFVKKTQKTPPGELEKAFRYKKDYEDRNENI
ncbi:MAG: type II toxin-antitoxin system RelE/ParE family toxin [Planctomycetia bacterium]|nr:type II toxin-antitoxin system RelE/ParE family toxin [Planctomycetia bacterium]